MVRVLVALAVAASSLGCSATAWRSSWDKHKAEVARRQGIGDYPGALSAQQWLVSNALQEAPAEERGRAHDAARLLTLGDLYAQSDRLSEALTIYREVLRYDPTRIEDVLTGIDLMPLPAEQRDAYMEEFVRNAVSIEPQLQLGRMQKGSCWSYIARQIRVRKVRTLEGPNGLERRVVYDARPWKYDDRTHAWQPQDDWVYDAGEEILEINRRSNPYFHAIIAADGGFFTDGKVPPCHGESWSGPYDKGRRTIYVSRSLPNG